MSIDKEQAKRILKSRKDNIIMEPGLYLLQVTGVSPFSRDLANDAKQTHICNFKAMTGYHVSEANKALAEGRYQDAVNNQLSIGILDGQYVPQKGETVKVQISERKNKDGQTILVASAITEQSVKSTASANFDFGDEEEKAPAATEESAGAEQDPA